MPDVGALNTSSMAAHGRLPQNRISMCENSQMVVSNIQFFIFTNTWGMIPNLTNIFEMG